MYSGLLYIHSCFRWVALLLMVYGVYRAFMGFWGNKPFSKTDNFFRHWAATAAHIQFVIGMILYLKSPIVQYYWKNRSTIGYDLEFSFFGLYHPALMLVSVVILTIGSAMAKRKETDKEKYKTMLVWFSVSLMLVLIAIPWPFSPLVNRPFFRNF